MFSAKGMQSKRTAAARANAIHHARVDERDVEIENEVDGPEAEAFAALAVKLLEALDTAAA